jgi:hypothetical protein
MSEEINNDEINYFNQNNNMESPERKKKCVSKRKRKALINSDSENDERDNNNDLEKFNKQESKEEENTECTNNTNTRISKYANNKFNTIDKNNNFSSPFKDNLLQEKLKKIFINRDRSKFQYTKQEIPDNLKYHSDDSDSSESGLRKSRIFKKEFLENKNSNLF